MALKKSHIPSSGADSNDSASASASASASSSEAGNNYVFSDAGIELTPKQLVAELDQHIIGQDAAKRAVAIAYRNRWRRLQVNDAIKGEIQPKNILMIGPTGCGKTEIARRLAKLTRSPFLKVEATKFTEVGYVGRDVEQIIRDLTETAWNMAREHEAEKFRSTVEAAAQQRVLKELIGANSSETTRQSFVEKLQRNELDDYEIEIDLKDNSSNAPQLEIPGMPGAQIGMINLNDMFGKAFSQPARRRKLKVKDALAALKLEEEDKLLNPSQLREACKTLIEEQGIVFIDEIDKICRNSEGGVESGVSREGVQRDLLPLLEGTKVNTRHGVVDTSHILFVTAGAFHTAKPANLLPELQGRLPVRVELAALREQDLLRILQEPQHSLLKQYQAMLAVDNIELQFSQGALKKVAELTWEINAKVENVGARRLFTVVEALLEDISFTAPDMPAGTVIAIDAKQVESKITEKLPVINSDNTFIL